MLAMSSAFVLCWLILPSIYQLAHGVAAWEDTQVLSSGENVTLALALTPIAQVAVLVGYLGSSVRGSCQPRTDMKGSARVFSRLGVVLIGASAAILPYVVRMKGGFEVLFMPRDVQSNYGDPALDLGVSGGVTLYLVEFVPFSLSVAGTLLLIAEYRMPKRGRSIFVGLALVVGALLTWIYANPIANSRFVALATLGSLALAVLWPRSRAAGRLVVLIFSFVALLLYPLIRLISTSEENRTDMNVMSDPWLALASADFDGFQQVINMFEFVQDHGYSFGHYVLSALLVFVPRSIWPGKATPASIDVAANHGYSFTNLSLPPHAEIYMEAGLLGMLVVFFIVGRVWAWLDSRWSTNILWQPTVAFLALAQVGIIRGPLGSQMPVMMLTLLVLLAATRFALRADNLSLTDSGILDAGPVKTKIGICEEEKERIGRV
jgi:hypothetical protein